MKKMNKKGFTLVELLAVIVILALIMAIAVVSMSGIMTSARNSTFKETGVQIINGVQQQLTLANELLPSDTSFETGVKYYVPKKMIEKGGDSAPLGGSYSFFEPSGKTMCSSTVIDNCFKTIGDNAIYRAYGNVATSCEKTGEIYVKVTYDGNNFKYSICVPTGAGYAHIDDNNGTLEKLLDNNDVSMINK